MSTENINNDLPEGSENQEQQAPEYTPIELKALDMGWRPKSEFNGAEEDFIDAKEFVNRKPLFDRIETQSKQIKNVTNALNALKLHYTKVQETEFNRALAALKVERKEALRDGDADKFDHLDDQIKDVESQIASVKEAAGSSAVVEETVHPEFQAWSSKNSWYNTTGYMRAFADDVGGRLAQQGLSPSEVLKQVETAVRKEFPHKFTNPNKELAPDVGSSRQPASRTKSDDIELTDTERRIMNTLIASDPKTFTKEKYLADLKKIREQK
jgi:regulator of replication initiation timing